MLKLEEIANILFFCVSCNYWTCFNVSLFAVSQLGDFSLLLDTNNPIQAPSSQQSSATGYSSWC